MKPAQDQKPLGLQNSVLEAPGVALGWAVPTVSPAPRPPHGLCVAGLATG